MSNEDSPVNVDQDRIKMASVDPGLQSDFPDLGSRYDVLAAVGRGGMGTVFKVRDLSLDKIMAIKLLQKELAEDAAARKRFAQEVEAASRLTHPNLVSIYGHGETDSGIPFLIMDYIEGDSLADVIERDGRLEPERALQIFAQVAEAVAHAHQQNIIHRDIKPTNVILSRTDNDVEIARVVDFGIAKVLPSASRETRDLTQTGEVFGSPHYMSPEQCLGFMLDQRSDIYSFGCLMYETLSGAPPFGGSNPIQLVVKHIHDDAPSFPAELKGSRTMQSLESVIMHCLEKEQQARYQSIEELKQDLELLKSGKSYPRYQVTKKTKPTLTKRQTIGAIALTFLLFFYLGVGGSAFSSSLVQKVFSILMLCICGGGVYAFLPAGVQLLKKIKGSGTPRQWWLALMQISIGLLSIGFTPYLLKEIIIGYQQPPQWYSTISGFSAIGQAFFTVLAVVSAIAYFLPSQAKKARFPMVAANAAIMMISITAAASFMFPQQVSRFPYWLGDKFQYGQRDLAVQCYKLAARLNKDNEQVIFAAGRLLEELGKFQEARDLYASAHKRETCKENLFYVHLRLKEFDRASSMLPDLPNRSYLQGLLFSARGQFDEALRSFRFSTDQSAGNGYYLGALCGAGRFDEALDKLKDDDLMSNVRRGMILDQIGRHDLARESFKRALDNFKNENGWYNQDFQLALAYSAYRLGDMEQYRRFLEGAENRNSFPANLVRSLGFEFSPIKALW
ncbi:MAG: protein kinase [Candidatus Melainabacteria bacterium]|nr:protein kinase [Candidatus Melainabacteria bacterium]